MRLDSLTVIHLLKGPQTDLSLGALIQERLQASFFLDSCQRWLWICFDGELDRADLPEISGLQVQTGTAGYEFLLRVATGLESQIVGETDIFGQLKEAWRKGAGNGGADSHRIDALMQKVFEDTKDIRSRFMQNLGGASYGSLVRMLLKSASGPTLLVGAGQIAQSVAPYLMDGALWLTNRNRENLIALYGDLISRQANGTVRMLSPSEEEQAWNEAAQVVVCIPFDELRDSKRVAWVRNKGATVIHLGGVREQAGAWSELADFYALDDLFALQKAQGDVRMTQVHQAARACEERAKLRALGASVTIPHGWEDLAVFA